MKYENHSTPNDAPEGISSDDFPIIRKCLRTVIHGLAKGEFVVFDGTCKEILALARAGVVETFRGIPIVSPREFIDQPH